MHDLKIKKLWYNVDSRLKDHRSRPASFAKETKSVPKFGYVNGGCHRITNILSKIGNYVIVYFFTLCMTCNFIMRLFSINVSYCFFSSRYNIVDVHFLDKKMEAI